MSEDKAEKTHRNLAKRTNEMLKGMSTLDRDTGLLNKRGWLQKKDEYERLATRTGQPLAYIMLDLDDLKTVNDNSLDHHTEGDVLIKKTAEIFKDSLRETDVAARYGGDEFTAALPATNLADAVPVMNRILSALNTAGIKASIGVGSSFEEADKEMYKMKKTHKNG